jgi:uncharacterized protein (TIGR00269 family)
MKLKSDKRPKCSRCKKQGVIELPYSKESLCDNCFADFFEKRVRKTVRLNRLLEGNDKTAVALSGGKDSAVALYTLHQLTKINPRAQLVAISIDQGMGKFQTDGLDAAKKLCKTLDIEHRLYSFKKEYGFSMDEVVKRTRKKEGAAPPCSYCGVLRRKLINQKAKEVGATKVATGHNMDDEIQAGVMNYVRGDLARTARMGAKVGTVKSPLFVPRIKPLRDSPENEVKAYAKIRKLPFEPSRCPYSGEAFRGTIRKAIDEIDQNHPGTKFQILKSTDQLIKILRERETPREITHCRICGDPTSGEVCNCCAIIDYMRNRPVVCK